VREELHTMRRYVSRSAEADLLEQVRELKERVSSSLEDAQAQRGVLEGVLADPGPVADVCGGGALAQVELVLEEYTQRVHVVVEALESLEQSAEGVEKFLFFRLDSSRNRLIKVDVIATFLATAMATGSMVAGIFGMNLPIGAFQNDQKDDRPFLVTAVSIIVGVLVVVTFLLVSLFGCQPLRSAAGCLLDVCCPWRRARVNELPPEKLHFDQASSPALTANSLAKKRSLDTIFSTKALPWASYSLSERSLLKTAQTDGGRSDRGNYSNGVEPNLEPTGDGAGGVALQSRSIAIN